MTTKHEIDAVRSLGDPWLSDQQARILLALYEHGGRPMDYDAIEERLAPSVRDDVPNLIKVQIHNIRGKLERDAVISRHGRGYVISDDLRSRISTAIAGTA